MAVNEPAPPGLSPRPLQELVREVEPLRETDTVREAAARITPAGGGLPVVDEEGRLVGYIGVEEVVGALFPPYIKELRHTEFLRKDFRSLIERAAKAAERSVGEVMDAEPEWLTPADSETHAAELFLHHHHPTLAVVDEERRIRGVVRVADIITSLLAACGRLPGPS